MSLFTLHIFLSSIENETRLYKEAAYTLESGICGRVAVLGLWREGLETRETTEFGLEIYRNQTMIRHWRNSAVLRRVGVLRWVVALLSLVQYAFTCLFAARRMRPDHVSCHNAIMLPVAWAAARFSGATLEYLPHELETERAGLGGLAKKLTAMVERSFIHSARNVVVVCDPICDWYRSTYGLENVHVVRNVPERSAVEIRPLPEPGFRERFRVPETATLFIYQGQISMGRGVEELLDIFGKLDQSKAHIVFMGYTEGRYQGIIDAAVRDHPNIHFQPAVPRDQIVSYSSSADVGIFIVKDAPLSYRYALPNKFFEWVHAGVPVLVSDSLEYLSQLTKEGGLGWSCQIDDVEAKIREICETDLASYVENVRRFAAPAVWDEDAQVFAHVYRTISMQDHV